VSRLSFRVLMRRLHRWLGLFLTGVLLFYALTGLLLNHRKDFSYFLDRQVTESRVPVTEVRAMRSFIDRYKAQIGRSDDPSVIRIRSAGTIEFLYGSHGKITYVIEPAQGRMRKIEKRERQPWSRLNRLHKVVKTSAFWLAVADFSCLAIVLLTVSGLVLTKVRIQDWILVGSGFLLPVLGWLLA